jgi:hypothetical protein
VTRPSLRRRLLIVVAAGAGAVCFRNAFATIRAMGWAAWPLALLLCVLAAAAWQMALMLVRGSRTVRTHADAQVSDERESDASRPESPPSS